MSQVPPPTGERWNVNMPAIVGIVFVLLVALIVWLVVATGGEDDAATSSTIPATTGATSTIATTTSVAPPLTTTPVQMPETSLATSTVPTTTTPPTTLPTTGAPTTVAPATTAAGADPDAVPGDLGVDGHPMEQPVCNGSAITVIASVLGSDASAAGMESVLEQYSGSHYLRTDQSCRSLTQSVGGEPVYVVFFGPFAFESDACQARADGPDDAYARLLSDEVGPDHAVDCD